MKRQPYKNPLKYYCYGKIKEWFKWNKCKICGQEFRREKGWWVRTLNDMCHPSFWYPPEYICKDCIKTDEEMIAYLKAEESKRPIFPPCKD
jgi:hypothetical protein